jgi:hypothetical protein
LKEGQKMRLKKSTTIAAGAAAVLLSAGYAGAAPLSVAVKAPTSAVTAVAAHHGERYGYRSRYRTHNIPEDYRTGTNNWWQEMDRQDRGGRR